MTITPIQQLHDDLERLSNQNLEALEVCFYWLDNDGMKSDDNTTSVVEALKQLNIIRDNNKDILRHLNSYLKEYGSLRGLEIDFPFIFTNLDGINFDGVEFEGVSISSKGNNSYSKICDHLPCFIANDIHGDPQKYTNIGFIGCNISNSSFNRCHFNGYSFLGITSNFPEEFFKRLGVRKPEGLSEVSYTSLKNCNLSNAMAVHCFVSNTVLNDCDMTNSHIYNSFISDSSISYSYDGRKNLKPKGNYPAEFQHCSVKRITLADPFLPIRDQLPSFTQSSKLTGLSTKWGGVSYCFDEFFLRNQFAEQIQAEAERNSIILTEKDLSDRVSKAVKKFIADDRKTHAEITKKLQEQQSDIFCFYAKLPDFDYFKSKYPHQSESIDEIKQLFFSENNQGVFGKFYELPQMMLCDAIEVVIQHPKKETLFRSIVSELDSCLSKYEDVIGRSKEYRGKETYVKPTEISESYLKWKKGKEERSKANLSSCDLTNSGRENRRVEHNSEFSATQYAGRLQSRLEGRQKRRRKVANNLNRR